VANWEDANRVESSVSERAKGHLKGLRVPLRILLRINIDQVWTGVCGRSRDVQLEARLARIRTDSHNEARHLAARTHAFDKLVSVKR